MCLSPCPHAHRTTAPGTGWEGRWCRAQASGGFSAVSASRYPWRPRRSVARQQSRSGCQSGTDGIDPADCGERIERCPPVRKSAVAFQIESAILVRIGRVDGRSPDRSPRSERKLRSAPHSRFAQLSKRLAGSQAIQATFFLEAGRPQSLRPNLNIRNGSMWNAAERPCASTARSRSRDQRPRRSPVRACTRRCHATPPAPASAHRGRGGDERPVVRSRRAKASAVASFDSTESRKVGQARREPRLSGVPLARTGLELC